MQRRLLLSQLVVISYPDEGSAQRALETLRGLGAEKLIDLQDAAYVTRDSSGKPKLHQTVSVAGEAAVSGAFWGFLIGMLFLAPVLGLAAGAVVGGLAGKRTDLGIDDTFMKDLGKQIQPGTAALFLLVRSATADKVVPEMAKHGGTILKTSLSNEAEARLKEALGHPTPTATDV